MVPIVVNNRQLLTGPIFSYCTCLIVQSVSLNDERLLPIFLCASLDFISKYISYDPLAKLLACLQPV